MKIIENNYTNLPCMPDVHTCHWCRSKFEISKEDIRKDTMFYSQREIDEKVQGVDCPCCNKFTAIK